MLKIGDFYGVMFNIYHVDPAQTQNPDLPGEKEIIIKKAPSAEMSGRRKDSDRELLLFFFVFN